MNKQQFRDLHLFNGHDITRMAGDTFYISYIGPDRGRGGDGACFAVIGLKFKTDPDGPWYNYGNKTFNLFGSSKEQALFAAQVWCCLRGYVLDYTEWERGPLDDWHPKGSIKRAVKAAQERAKKYDWVNGSWVKKEEK